MVDSSLVAVGNIEPEQASVAYSISGSTWFDCAWQVNGHASRADSVPCCLRVFARSERATTTRANYRDHVSSSFDAFSNGNRRAELAGSFRSGCELWICCDSRCPCGYTSKIFSSTAGFRLGVCDRGATRSATFSLTAEMALSLGRAAVRLPAEGRG